MDKIKIAIAVSAFAGGFVFGKIWQERKDCLEILNASTELLKLIQESPLYGEKNR